VRCGVAVREDAILETGTVVLKDVKPWMIVIEKIQHAIKGRPEPK
jgi:tetrahydrodipicolinate N-succinyltransferase